MLTKTKEIRIENCTICNYDCVMCTRGSFTRKQECMGNELFESIVQKTREQLPYIDSITLSGFGEFSLDPQWRYKLELCSKHFSHVHIVTNGSTLVQADLNFILSHVSDIRVSIYGMDADAYRGVHCHPKSVRFDKILENIEYIIRHKSSRQRIILNFIEVEENRHQTQAFIEHWEDRVDLVEVWKPHNWVDGKTYRETSGLREPTCGRPFNGPIQVQADGTVNVCCFDYNGKMVIGDLKTQDFNEIFDGKAMEEIQNIHSSGRADELPLCAQCDQRNSSASKRDSLIFNSKFSIEERVNATSTDYDTLIS